MDQPVAALVGSLTGAIRVCTPKLSVMTSDLVRVSVPTSSSIGMTYQSLPKLTAKSLNNRCGMSPGPAGSRP